jgi:hypothetical protein
VVDDREVQLQSARMIYGPDDPLPAYSEFERDSAGVIRYRTELTPDMVRVVNMASQGNMKELARILRPAAIPPGESLKAEVEAFIGRHRAKGGKAWYGVKSYLDVFLSVTGDIRLSDVTVQNYRAFLAKLEAYPTWGDVTRLNCQRQLHTFLKRVEADHSLTFGFIRNPDYKRQIPDGEKVQWTMEQVRTAIKHADGTARTYLMLALNCGFHAGDVVELKPDHFNGTHINKARAKLKGRRSPFVGSWKVWPETVAALMYGLTLWHVHAAFDKLRSAHNLPEAKALRKTVARWIQDHVGEEEARLYRAEKVAGGHGKYYIGFSPEQRVKLDRALDGMHAMIFGG